MDDNEIMSRKGLAEYLGVSEDALHQMATRGTGPKYAKLSGRLVRYRMEDVRAWLENNLVSSTKDRRGSD